jgi:hypothetical protein
MSGRSGNKTARKTRNNTIALNAGTDRDYQHNSDDY